MSPTKDYKLTVTSELVTVTFTDGVTATYPTDSVELVASAYNGEIFTISSDATNGTTLSWKRVTNRYPTSRDNLLTLISASIASVKAVGAFSSLTVSGAVTAASVTASGALAGATVAATGAITGASAALTGAVTSATVTTTGAITGASVVTDTISEQTGAAGVTVDGVLLKDSEVTTDVINEKTAAAGVTADGVLLKDNAVTATSGAMLGTMTVSSSGALGGTFTTGKRVYVTADFFLSNVSAAYQNMLTESSGGVIRRSHEWPEDVNWTHIAIGADDVAGRVFETRLYTDTGGAAIISTQSTTCTSTHYQYRQDLTTPTVTNEGDAYWFTCRQTNGGTTGSELTLTIWGYYEQ